MNRHIEKPTLVEAAGNIPKLIEEFVGLGKLIEEFVGLGNSGTSDLSIARMKSPAGWEEPGQTPDFDEYTVVLAGSLRVETRDGVTELQAGQAYIAMKGTWVRYSSPAASGAEYVSVCVPAFAPGLVNRDAGEGAYRAF